jgi:adenine-specific DNA-methyltransferase
MNDAACRIADLLVEEPSLAPDLVRWVEQSRALGRDRPFIAYREATGIAPQGDVDRLILRRSCGSNERENILYHSDNLPVLRELIDFGERARCVYIDPPYGTSQQFARKVTDHAAYCDAATGAAYLAMIRARLILIREILADDGSLFVHLDSSMVGEVKVLLDELFGSSNFRGWITRRKCSSKNYTRKGFGDITDYVLFYTRSANYVWNRQFEQRSGDREAVDFPKRDSESGRRFALVPLHAPGRRNGASGSAWRGMKPPAGKHWQWTPDKLEMFAERGDIYWTKNGTPRRKIWADESPGAAVSNLWLEFRDPFNQNFAVTGYPTEKNIEMLRRIISAASNPGDLVLDCYSGSGTTLAAAAELDRRWIGIDKGDLAIALSQRRMIEQTLARDSDELSCGFDFCGPHIEERLDTSADWSDVEFALIEAVDRQDGVGVVHRVLSASQAAAKVGALKGGGRIVTFDHGGRERCYRTMRSIQSAVSLPA